jgi:photosystem II stability/assembly factor-like uncharacterized protein
VRAGATALALLFWLTGWAPAPAWARCQGTVSGPCNTPEPVAFFPGTGADPVVITNFGLLYPGQDAGSWQLVCDDLYGLALPAGLRRSADGRVYAGAGEGLRFSSDGCTWSDGAGTAAGQAILDVAVDTVPGRVWTLAELPARVLRSDDGGAQFNLVHAFDPGQPLLYHRLVAGGDGQRLYLFGRGSNNTTPAAVSTDGGQTFTTFDLSARAVTPPPSPLEFLAAAPGNPPVLYFQVFDASGGDQLWRTADDGQTVAPILKLERFETLGGFSFGADAQVLYLGAVNAFAAGGTPPGFLYVSRNSGTTWEPPVPSPPTGPRYRCLTHSEGKLYACGAGEILGDAFLVGVSSDEGRSWQPHVRLRDVAGARSCAKARCLATEIWLCELHGQCAADAGTPALPDASADAGPAPSTSGCSCSLGGGTAPGVAPVAVLAVLLALKRSRPRARRPSTGIAKREARKA